MFGIGPTELLILFLMVFVIGLPVAVVVLIVLMLLKRSPKDGSPSYAQLLEENQRLREQLAAERGKSTQDPT